MSLVVEELSMSSNSSPEGGDKISQSDYSNLSNGFDSESDQATPEDLRRDYNRTKKYSHSRNSKPSSFAVNPYAPKGKRSNGVIKVSSKDSSSILEKASTARRFKINDLQNEIKLLNQKIKELESENKLLKRTQRRQSIALKRYEGNEGDLPILLRRHEEEVRSLRDQLRKMTEKYRTSDRFLRDRTTELMRVQMQLQRLQTVVREQNLEERSVLSKKVDMLQSELENKDKMIQDGNHHLELTEKNYKHQLSIEFARHRETKKRLTELQTMLEKMNITTKDKEREIDTRNIFRSPRSQGSTSRIGSSPKSQSQSKLDNDTKPKSNNKNIYQEHVKEEKIRNENSNGYLVKAASDSILPKKGTNGQAEPSSALLNPSYLYTPHQRLEDSVNIRNSVPSLQLGDIGQDSNSEDFQSLPYRHQMLTLTDEGVRTENRQQFLEPVFLQSLDSLPSERMQQNSMSDTRPSSVQLSPVPNNFRSVSSINGASDKDPPEFRDFPITSNKTRKLNLMQQLFGSLEGSPLRIDDEKQDGHVVFRASSSPNSTTAPVSIPRKYKSPGDNFIDLFNNNAPSNVVVSRHGRERSYGTPKHATKPLTENNVPEDDTTSVLF